MEKFMRAVRELNITIVQLNFFNPTTWRMEARRFDNDTKDEQSL